MLRSVLSVLLKVRKDPLRTFKSFGLGSANRAIWDAEYALGNWDYLDKDRNGEIPVKMIEKYAPNGRLLDLGCGTSLNLPLDPGTYQSYLGVDISKEAIAKARSLNRPHAGYEVADILTYRPQGEFDAILLREVLYYLPRPKVRGLLEGLALSLSPAGVVIVQIWHAEMYDSLLAEVRGCSLPVIEEMSQATGRTLTLARPGSAT
jgi:SAM-dependent methyltransferase